MIIRSFQQTIPGEREKRGGLKGQGIRAFNDGMEQARSFEDFLEEAFQGQTVQKGGWFAPALKDTTKSKLSLF